MVGMTLRTSPFSPFTESVGVSERLRSPFRGEERTGGDFGETSSEKQSKEIK